jgi:hypothetical protein
MSNMPHTRSITLLNGTGDVTISWSEDRDEQMEAWIQKKMDEGYTFFTLPDSFFGRLSKMWQKEPLKTVADVGEGRTVYLDDESAEKLFSDGVVGVSQTPGAGNIDTTGVAHTPREVVRSRSSCAVRPIAGG